MQTESLALQMAANQVTGLCNPFRYHWTISAEMSTCVKRHGRDVLRKPVPAYPAEIARCLVDGQTTGVEALRAACMASGKAVQGIRKPLFARLRRGHISLVLEPVVGTDDDGVQRARVCSLLACACRAPVRVVGVDGPRT